MQLTICLLPAVIFVFVFFVHQNQSFSTLVVLLKVLLNQQGLDKPFTGGLGSYALYVMVASHVSIERFESRMVVIVPRLYCF